LIPKICHKNCQFDIPKSFNIHLPVKNGRKLSKFSNGIKIDLGLSSLKMKNTIKWEK